jgi:hypothetical protein
MTVARRRKRLDLHEQLEREDTSKAGSDRSFGLVISAALTTFGLLPLLRGHPARGWLLVMAAGFVVPALIRPRLLGPLNRAWTWLGIRLHRIVSPLVLGLVFYTTVTPIGLVLRLLGKDLLRQKIDPSLPTYWILRRPAGPPPDTMRYQF